MQGHVAGGLERFGGLDPGLHQLRSGRPDRPGVPRRAEQVSTLPASHDAIRGSRANRIGPLHALTSGWCPSNRDVIRPTPGPRRPQP